MHIRAARPRLLAIALGWAVIDRAIGEANALYALYLATADIVVPRDKQESSVT